LAEEIKMKTLVVYYSRTGNTKKIGDEIAGDLKCDIDEITEKKKRNGMLGFVMSGREAVRKTTPKINPAKFKPEEYDLVIIGTPNWATTIASPVRTYITMNKFKDVAFFCTQGSGKDQGLFKKMEEVAGKKPVATLRLSTKQVQSGDYDIDKFLESIRT